MELVSGYEKKYGATFRLWFGKYLVIATTDLDAIQVRFFSSRTRNLFAVRLILTSGLLLTLLMYGTAPWCRTVHQPNAGFSIAAGQIGDRNRIPR